jgi:hypothetical protein
MMSKPIVPAEQLEAVIRQMPDAFTILDFVDACQEKYPAVWDMLVERYGLCALLSADLSQQPPQRLCETEGAGVAGTDAQGLEAEGLS